MLRALLAAAVTGLAAPAVGTYLVQRRLSLMGDGIGHVCVTGVALGLLTGTSPTLTAVIVAILGALLIELIRSTGKATGDVALALLFYGGIAGGLLLVSLGGNGVFALQQYLFGSITTISPSAVVVSVALAGRRARALASRCCPSCSRSPTTRTTRARPDSRCASTTC